jgi:hypothetical protein
MPRRIDFERLKNTRATALRLVEEKGRWERARGRSWFAARHDLLEISYSTPFQRFHLEDEKTRIMRLLVGGKPNLPYGLNVWHLNKKVMNVEWDDEGNLEVICYKPGDWEAALQQAARLARQLSSHD